MTTSKPSLIEKFMHMEASGGIMLMAGAIVAMICANSALSVYYDLLLSTPVEVRMGALEIAKPLLLWINDGLMAIFFFLVGLELKREILEGELSDKRNIMLPAIGAVGGMAAPAAIYLAFNAGDPVAVQGWAIPAATDIAFALGVLSLLGSRVPVALKVFLTSLAIFDDLGAIIIIALFYTAELSWAALAIGLVSILLLWMLNRDGVMRKSPYLLVGLMLWTAMLKSGVHATLAGVVLAMFMPMRNPNKPDRSPVKELEHDLHGVVAFFILPVFAFANAGLDLRGMGMDSATHTVPVGIALGLFIGKQAGIFGLCYLAIKAGLARLPSGMTWFGLYGTSALCGIGFTMSLFIGSLAFEQTGVERLFDERLGIIVGSLLSGIVGYLLLNKCLPKSAAR